MKLGPFKFPHYNRKNIVITTILFFSIILLTLLMMSQGDYMISFPHVIDALLGRSHGLELIIVRSVRLPQSLMAITVGLALGVSGAITQAVTRNGLSSPDILGITQGASLAAVMTITFGFAVTLPVASAIGAVITGIIVYALAWKQGVSPIRIMLIGIAFSALCSALTALLLIRASIDEATKANAWTVGSLDELDMSIITPVSLIVIMVIFFAVIFAFELKGLTLGDDIAAGIGVNVHKTRTILLVLAVVLTGLAVSIAGPIGFVAFASPHIAQRFINASYPPLVISGLCGAIMLMIADLVSRNFIPRFWAWWTQNPNSHIIIPTGLITIILGAPLLIFLIANQSRKSLA